MPDTHLRQLIDTLLDAAGAAFRAHEHAAAASKLDAAVRLDPGHPGTRLLQAKLSLHHEDPRGALEALDAIEQHASGVDDRPDVALTRYAALVALGKREEAIEVLEALSRRLPSEPRVIEPLAELYLETGRAYEAAAALRRLVHLRPGDPRAERQLARALETVDPQAAIGQLCRCIEAADTADRPPLRLRVARLCREQGRLTEALIHYDALLANHPGGEGRPDEPRLWIEAGRVSDELGDLRGARRRLKRALSLGGRDQEQAAAALAVVEMHAGEIGKAGRLWKRATRSRGQTLAAKAWAGLLVCAESAGRTKLAKRAERELDLRVSRTDARRLLATMWQSAASGKAVAEAASQKGVRDDDDPQSSPLRSLLAATAATMSRLRTEHPDRADVQYHTAVAADMLGDADLAQEAAGKALQINPRYAAARGLAGRMGYVEWVQ